MTSTIAERLFDQHYAECEIDAVLEDEKVPYSHIGWDHYDCSLEIHGVDPEWRPSDDLQRKFKEWGFSTVFINHTDKWETHYHYADKEPPVKGWRVSYPHKHGEEEKGIWVEEFIPTWPKEWFDTGYVIIRDSKNETTKDALCKT